MIYIKTSIRTPSRIGVMWRPRIGAVLCLVAAAALPLPAPAQEPQRLPTVTLRAGMHNIVAMVARTPEQRATGLMWRREMASHEGMLFVFEQPATQCFWMRNTYLPLTIAFLGDDGTIVNLADMQPHATDSHCSAQPVRYALEMNQGWLARRAIKPGYRLAGGPFGDAR